MSWTFSMVSFAVLLCANTTIPFGAPSTILLAGNETERLSLLAFRDQITDGPRQALSSWKDTVHFCRWEGVTCSSQSQRVISLSLPSRRLAGTISPYLGNLSFLQELNLGDNNLVGEIPSELGNLINLRILNLSTNSLGGRIPANLSRCKELDTLELSFNILIGAIPAELTSLSKLDFLQLIANNLTGSIPRSVGNLSALTTLAMGRNNLAGSIPDTIGLITRLDFLQIAENQLSGTIPQSLYNLSSLTFIAIATNQLQGSLPMNLGLALPKLDTLYVGGNQLIGHIPNSILNASGFINLDLAENNFTGSVPANIGRLGGLEWLNFEGNQLGFRDENGLGFLTTLTNCTNLQVLDIDSNRFEGVLPSSIGNLSTQLSMLILGGNQIHGSVPEGIGNLAGLTVLRMEKNFMTGSIPVSIGRLQNLQLLALFRNRISGQIPPALGNLTRLTDLRLGENLIEGTIPPSLGNCQNLQTLDLSQNKLNGTIPLQVMGISSLSVFLSLADNSLIGPLPAAIGELKNIGSVDISENRLFGKIPEELGDCESIEYLQMQGNMFQGPIPSALSRLKGIRYLDLSRNNLSGQVPGYLENLHFLWHLNLSFNDLVGSLPKEGVFKNASAVSVLGNEKLCGGSSTLQLPSCPNQNSKTTGRMHIVIPIVCTVSALVSLSCLLGTFSYLRRSKRKHPPVTSLEEFHSMVSYNDLFKATEGFSSANCIGEGSYGTVYKGTLGSNETAIAVKVFNLQQHGASMSFMSECEALRHIRHRNLIKILTSCSTVDNNGNDFKALVYEFMPNGSLEDRLHPKFEQHQSKVLSFVHRLNISTDIASALDYLHNQCQLPVVHRDLKPSNILLDDDMTARVSDFGLAKVINDSNSQIQTKSVGIKGSIGYIPPEYGAGGEVTTQGDAYSYGILLLEIFTGQRPTSDSFGDGLCLHDLAKMAYPKRVMEIIDPSLLLHGDITVQAAGSQNEMSCRIKECLVSLIGIGVSCSEATPKERMEMREVATKMHNIKKSYLSEHGISAKCGIST